MDGGSRDIVCIEEISESSFERTKLFSTRHHPHSSYQQVASRKKEDKRISGKKHGRDESTKKICNSKSLVFDDDDDFCLDSIQKRSQVVVVNSGVDASKGSSKAEVKGKIIEDEVEDDFYVENVQKGRKNDVHCRKKHSNYEKVKALGSIREEAWRYYIKA
ncbi:uncharacterized protein LOC107805742 isoform X2 [Nicotiana tabacum]|uniref:Uncharacterized protein LOC107805742 isoform X2 n=1 Tax=Nicotiana tabacum TaxID=4097 RepID=A0A1S4B8Y5_TOBAC|nr:PREDICTED: uncharacterized protein LOC107805742 isoform X2 [Nicotiana tabacum]